MSNIVEPCMHAYVNICAFTYVYTYVYVCIYGYVRPKTCLPSSMNGRWHEANCSDDYLHMHVNLSLIVSLWLRLNVCMCAIMYVRMYVSVHAYVCANLFSHNYLPQILNPSLGSLLSLSHVHVSPACMRT